MPDVTSEDVRKRLTEIVVDHMVDYAETLSKMARPPSPNVAGSTDAGLRSASAYRGLEEYNALATLAKAGTCIALEAPESAAFGSCRAIVTEARRDMSGNVSGVLRIVSEMQSVYITGSLLTERCQADTPSRPFTPNKYTRDMPTLDGRMVPVDVYCVLAAFPTGSAAVDHAIKKLLAPGQRGAKSRIQDLKEARASLDRAIELEEGKE